MSSITSEIIIILLLILANGMLAMSEIALISVRKSCLQQLADDGDAEAKVALQISSSPNDFLSTVQIGITAVGILAGAFGGATIAEELGQFLKNVPAIAPYADALALGLVVAAITYCSLIIGELVPKRLALHSPEKIARLVAVPMRFLSLIAKPLVALLTSSTDFVMRMLRVKEPEEWPVTEAEIQVLVEQATQAGVFEESEQEMVASVLRLGDRKVASIMTPRTDVVWIDVNTNEEKLLQLLNSSPHARFPVSEKSLDHVLGIVESKTIMHQSIRRQPIELSKIIIQPLYIPESTTALQLLECFRDTKQHLAFVMDEYGGLQGLVTRDDIFEAIVGELPTLGESPKWEVFQREDGSWFIDGQSPVDEFKEIFDLDKLPGEDESDYHTLAGFILFYLDRLPQTGECFEWQGLRFEIVDMDGHRIDKVLVSKVTS